MIRPGWVSTIVVAIVAATCVRLGFWQLSRYDTRSGIAEAREERHAQPELTALPQPDEALDYRRVRLSGHFREGAVATGGIKYRLNGYAALGVLELGDRDALVLRGWIPVDGWTDYLEVDDTPVEVTGILHTPPEAADVEVYTHPIDDAPLWPLVQERFLGMFRRGTSIPYRSIARALGADPDVVIIAGPELESLDERKATTVPAGGYTTYLKVFHHLEYAVQWFAFAAIAVGLWLWYGFRRARRA